MDAHRHCKDPQVHFCLIKQRKKLKCKNASASSNVEYCAHQMLNIVRFKAIFLFKVLKMMYVLVKPLSFSVVCERENDTYSISPLMLNAIKIFLKLQFQTCPLKTSNATFTRASAMKSLFKCAHM